MARSNQSDRLDFPLVWRKMFQSDLTGSGKSYIQWKTVCETLDTLRELLEYTEEYEQFFWHAYVGSDSDVSTVSKELIEQKKLKGRSPFSPDVQDEVLDADLVARLSLAVAREIGRAVDETYNFSLVAGEKPLSGDGQVLRFLSADFVVAEEAPKRVRVNKKGETYQEDEDGSLLYYDYRDENGQICFRFHGWRMSTERKDIGFSNNPYGIYKTDSSLAEKIETFLAFPAFFSRYDAHSVFHFCEKECNNPGKLSHPSPSSCDHTPTNSLNTSQMYTDFVEIGLKPYKKIKEGEFNDRKNSGAQASLSFSFGVPRQRAAYFIPEMFDAGYGVFFTVDFQNFSQECLNCDKIIEAGNKLTSAIFRFQYIVAHVLAGRLNRKLQREKVALQKKEEMLILLQRPLDALTDAFAKVQSEAQEMQSILNEPEEGLFKSHRLLAPIFRENHVIKISPFVTFTCKHNYNLDRVEDIPLLRKAYSFALCAIFGEQHSLKDAQTDEAVTQLAYSALKRVRERGVHSEMIKPLSVICGFNTEDIEESILRLPSDKNDEQLIARLSGALQNLKAVLFTPFKDFSENWPILPVQLALFGVDDFPSNATVSQPPRTSKLPADLSPIPQHAVLAFLVSLREALASDEYKLRIKSFNFITNGDVLDEYRITLTSKDPNETNKRLFFDEKKGSLNSLQEFLQACLRHHFEGENVGSFLSVFYRLLRHAPNTTAIGGVVATAVKDQWLYLKPPQSSGTTHLLLALGKCTRPVNNVLDVDKISDEINRYFFVVQKEEEDVTNIRLIWTNCASAWRGVMPLDSQPQSSAEGERQDGDSKQGGQEIHESRLLKIYIVDHDSTKPWKRAVEALGQWCKKEEQEFPSVENIIEINTVNDPSSITTDSNSIIILHAADQHVAKQWKRAHPMARRILAVSARGSAGRKYDSGDADEKFLIINLKAEDCSSNQGASQFYQALISGEKHE